ncbi:sugar ABC transporter ATP-binding protein [Microbispora sp. RL4-1S]|uniref:Sugar ABC transporter ATP-binding protein n=2 Tax=Microbispora TaxID=2005 RepID=A0A940WKX6_9ACTN|nr:sugar ABC transporter ATP-binding protein [Microbispora oryzae]MBP2703380.1 sugar ABC transporter ATP-binding protein [Microbispora oryzae]
MDEERPLLRMRGIVKQFPGVRALDGVDLEVRAGEVHCLLGQNGAGKSTLIKILSGAQEPDAGEILLDGEAVRLTTPTAAMARGIATIYQELDLVDGLSVADNIFLGHELASLGFSRRSQAHRATAGLMERLGHGEIRPGTEVGRLAPAHKQIVSMARALSHEARLIIMDEPSAALAHDEVANLFRVIRDLTSHGVAVVYISHRMEEIREIGDRVTVLKDGRTVAVGLPARETSTSAIVALMTGRNVEYVFPPRPESSAGQAGGDGGDDRAEVLRVENLSVPGRCHDISFSVRAGEIVGLAGLVGSGRSEIIEAIYGARRASGRVVLDGRQVRLGSTSRAVRLGMGLAPEERKAQALLLDESVGRNITLASLGRYSRGGWLDRRKEAAEAQRLVEALGIRPPDPRRAIRTLSGGNQQKAVIGRWLVEGRRLLLLDEPTRGVDVGARAELYALVRRMADEGVGVLLVSSEVPEVLGLADRVLVIREGRMVHQAAAGELDEHRVLDLVMVSAAPSDHSGSGAPAEDAPASATPAEDASTEEAPAQAADSDTPAADAAEPAAPTAPSSSDSSEDSSTDSAADSADPDSDPSPRSRQ